MIKYYNDKILSLKYYHTINKRRDRNKQHKVENNKEQASIPKKDRNRK